MRKALLVLLAILVASGDTSAGWMYGSIAIVNPPPLHIYRVFYEQQFDPKTMTIVSVLVPGAGTDMTNVPNAASTNIWYGEWQHENYVAGTTLMWRIRETTSAGGYWANGELKSSGECVVLATNP